MTRFRSVGSIASVLALVGATLLVGVPPASAAECVVTNPGRRLLAEIETAG